jgi:hypothetical protein
MEAQLDRGGDLVDVLAARAGRAHETQLHFTLGNPWNSIVRIHRFMPAIKSEMAFRNAKSCTPLPHCNSRKRPSGAACAGFK